MAAAALLTRMSTGPPSSSTARGTMAARLSASVRSAATASTRAPWRRQRSSVSLRLPGEVVVVLHGAGRHHHGGALGGQPLGGGRPDPPAGSGHDGPAPFEASHARHSSGLCQAMGSGRSGRRPPVATVISSPSATRRAPRRATSAPVSSSSKARRASEQRHVAPGVEHRGAHRAHPVGRGRVERHRVEPLGPAELAHQLVEQRPEPLGGAVRPGPRNARRPGRAPRRRRRRRCRSARPRTRARGRRRPCGGSDRAARPTARRRRATARASRRRTRRPRPRRTAPGRGPGRRPAPVRAAVGHEVDDGGDAGPGAEQQALRPPGWRRGRRARRGPAPGR